MLKSHKLQCDGGKLPFVILTASSTCQPPRSVVLNGCCGPVNLGACGVFNQSCVSDKCVVECL